MKRILLSVVFALALAMLASSVCAQQPPCCSITAIDTRAANVTAKINANGQTFQFHVADAKLLGSLRVGQGVYANFSGKQVSLDGKTACCAIVSGPSPAAPAAVPKPPVASTSSPGTTAPAQTATKGTTAAAATPQTGAQTAQPNKAAPGLAGVTKNATQFILPTVTAGTPAPVTPARVAMLAQKPGRFSSRSVAGTLAGQVLNGQVMHLRGLDGIEQSQGLPQGAKNLLLMHVRKLAAGESDHYIVNPQLAAQWIQAHPNLANVKAPEVSSSSHTGCNSFSWHCVQESAAHAAEEASRQAEKLREQAQADWNHITGELNHDLNMAEGCFVDHTISLGQIPVKFSITPQFPLNFEKDGKTTVAGGTASGSVKGNLTVGLPISPDFNAQLDLFYIPCLPFVVRPKAISANGTMTVGARFTASVKATGKFKTTFTIPPTGGPQIPIEVIPIVIAGVPVAEMDVSAYFEGTVDVDADGSLTSQFQLDAPHTTQFDFSCSGKECHLNAHNVPTPTTTTESVQVQGRIHVKPGIYIALQLDFDVDALSARAGPQPRLVGELAGCAYGSATQSTAAATTTQSYNALAGDLDWEIDLRAEVLIARQRIGNSYVKKIYPSRADQGHLWFQDLVQSGSTALFAGVDGPAQASAGKVTLYKVKPHPCYLYTDTIHYNLAWTGGATPAATPGCTWQAGGGTCSGDPKKDTAINLTWPSAGQYTLTVTPMRDDHGRVFKEPPTQLNVNVQAASATSPPGNQ